MGTDPEQMQAWLGPAWDELSAEQRQRFATVVDDVDSRYPDPDDQPLRDAALFAAVQWMLGEITAEQAGAALRDARTREELARAAARQVAVMAVQDGATEAGTARAVGVERAALRTWLGK